MKKTKTDQVKEHLHTRGSITSLDAFRLYNATRLASIIFELRKRGMKIETINRVKDGHCYAEYYLRECD